MSQFPLFIHLHDRSEIKYSKHNHIWTINTVTTKYGHNPSVYHADDGELWSVT